MYRCSKTRRAKRRARMPMVSPRHQRICERSLTVPNAAARNRPRFATARIRSLCAHLASFNFRIKSKFEFGRSVASCGIGNGTSFSVGRLPPEAGAIGGVVCVHFCSSFQNKTQPGRRIASEANGSRQWPQARPPRLEGDRQQSKATRFRTPSTQHGCRTQPPTRRRIARQRASPPCDHSSPFSPWR